MIAYYDANYLFKLQCVEHGTNEIRTHAASVQTLYSAIHARADYTSAAFRNVREGKASPAQFRSFLAQMHADAASGSLIFLPLTDAIIDRVENAFLTAPATTYLRAADALHLATAAEHGFAEIYSNDRHLLAAAPLFGLVGVNVIP